MRIFPTGNHQSILAYNFGGAVQMLRAAAIAILIVLLPAQARAEARFALLIGNQGYNAKVGPLKTPHDDVTLVGAALRSLGFTVTEIKDADYRSMDAAIKRHAATVRREGQGTISLVYYSGHGAADPDTRTNYLIPIDVTEADDADLWNFSLNLNNIVEGLRVQAPGATHYVVFDACRNELNLTHKGAKALTEKGFVPLAYTPGVMVAYATAPGKTATDTGSGGGPYAKALADELVKPGIEAMTMFRRVALRVNREIGQDPWMSASTLPEVYFAGGPAATGYYGSSPVKLSEAAEAWGAVRETTDPVMLEIFAARFKDSFYAELARSRLKELNERKVVLAAPGLSAARPNTRCDGVETQVGLEIRCLNPKETFKDCPNCPEMVVVPAGQFTMGSSPGEVGRFDNEGPQHEVTIGKTFAVGRFGITRGEFAAFVLETNHPTGDKCWTFEDGKAEERVGRSFLNPGFAQDDRHPVVCVNWDDAKAFAAWLAKKTGKPYRLLSEAEREYVARAGSTTRYSFGNDEKALCRYGNVADLTAKKSIKGAEKWTIADCDDGYAYTAPVGEFAPNAFGIYDVHGNVWDWTEDCWHENYQGAPADGLAWTTACSDNSRRVVRGGSWSYFPQFLRSALRLRRPSDLRYYSQGFRLARILSP